LIATVRDNDGSLQAAAYLQIPIELVQAAVAYYDEHHDQIDADIEMNETEYRRGFDAASAGDRAPHS
jgi:hypothetical protein